MDLQKQAKGGFADYKGTLPSAGKLGLGNTNRWLAGMASY